MARLTRTAPDAANRCCRGILALAVGTLALVVATLALAGRWLAPDASAPQAGDMILVLAGSYDRTLHAADLFHRGAAPRIVLSRPVAEPVHQRLAALGIALETEEQIQRRVLARRGVPAGAIDVLPGQARSTRDEAVALAGFLGDRPQRVIVVTSPSHVRRAGLLFRGLQRAGQQVQVVATPYEEFEWRWWRDPASARMVLLEVAKLAYLYLSPGAPS